MIEKLQINGFVKRVLLEEDYGKTAGEWASKTEGYCLKRIMEKLLVNGLVRQKGSGNKEQQKAESQRTWIEAEVS